MLGKKRGLKTPADHGRKRQQAARLRTQQREALADERGDRRRQIAGRSGAFAPRECRTEQLLREKRIPFRTQRDLLEDRSRQTPAGRLGL